jgi:predicted acetyltransferase
MLTSLKSSLASRPRESDWLSTHPGWLCMSLDANTVTIAPASEAERPLIEAMFQYYVYDFSEMGSPDDDDFDLDADGTFGRYDHMDAYWREPARVPLLIRRGGKLAGFALINDHSHSGQPLDRNFGEFFVMRKYRRGGVASAAVREILTRYPGRWEAAIMQRNVAAQAFWPRAVAATPGVGDVTMLQGDGVEWTGPILRFTVEA